MNHLFHKTISPRSFVNILYSRNVYDSCLVIYMIYDIRDI